MVYHYGWTVEFETVRVLSVGGCGGGVNVDVGEKV
jgi:hypothetical protein